MAKDKSFFGPKMKVPKNWMGTARTAWDPAGVDPLGINDRVFGGQDGPDYSEYEKEMADAIARKRAAADEFIAGGPENYQAGGDISFSNLGASRMEGIKTDPRYAEAEAAALRDLEEQAKSGFTAADRAEMAKYEMEANRANRGRQGAIQQQMLARGIEGSGMELAAQMGAAQDANEMAALRALEREGMGQERRQAASARLGTMAGQLSSRDFEREAAKARAADEVSRFNTQLANSAAQANWGRRNTVADANVRAGGDFRRDVMDARMGQNDTDYNWAAERENRQMLADQAAEKKAAGAMGMAGSVVGGVVGGYYGGPQGAAAGSQVGNAGGQMGGTTAYRNQRYGRR